MTNEMNRLQGAQGGCLCGAVRYRLLADPMYVQACHCTDCQTLSGSAFTINMWYEAANVEFRGDDPVSFISTAGSGEHHEVFRCGRCGTGIASKYHRSPAKDLMVRAGTLDDPGGVEPMAHIFLCSKQNWVAVPENSLRFDGFYNLFEVWPEASCARFKKILPPRHDRT